MVGMQRRGLTRSAHWLIVTLSAGALVAAGAPSAGAASAPSAVGVATALYAQGPNGAACVALPPNGQPITAVSYAGCPVSLTLAQSLAEYAALRQADPRCRCQNSFTVAVSSKLSKPPSGYRGAKADRVVKVTLVIGGGPGRITMFLIAHKSADGTWAATDLYCAARRGDKNPYANRVAGGATKDCANG
jgi:hypothetical protein